MKPESLKTNGLRWVSLATPRRSDKSQDGKKLPPVIREARGYGAGCVYTHQCYPNNMKCVICTELVNIQNEEICEECYLDL